MQPHPDHVLVDVLTTTACLVSVAPTSRDLLGLAWETMLASDGWDGLYGQPRDQASEAYRACYVAGAL